MAEVKSQNENSYLNNIPSLEELHFNIIDKYFQESNKIY